MKIFKKVTNNLKYNSNFLKTRFKLFSVLGIDIGGTNSYIAIQEPQGPRIIENVEGLRYTPSIITINEDGSILNSIPAKRQAVANYENSFYGAKFFLGRKFSDDLTEQLIKKFKFKIDKGSNDEILFINSNNLPFSPLDISTHILTYIREQAETLTGEQQKKAVMTVPNFMSEDGKEELRTAVKATGMNVLSFIDESAAAAYAYEVDKKEDVNNVLVFNLGGLNLSLALMKKKDIKEEEINYNNDNMFEIVKSTEDYSVGGEEIELIIQNYLLEEFKKANKGMDISNEVHSVQRIRESSENAKTELTLSQNAEISLAYLAMDQTGPKHLNTRISRTKFEILIDPLLDKIKAICEKFVKEIPEDTKIDEILLVGGISRIPLVQEVIKKIFKQEPNTSINPEEAPVLGAAIIGSKLKADSEKIEKIETLPLSIGIETLGGGFLRIIPKNTQVPFKIKKLFTTASDNQAKIDLKFFMGEREIASENKPLGEINLVIHLAKKSVPKIKLTCNLNNSGDFNVKAIEELSRKQLHLNTNICNGLTQDIIDEDLDIAMQFREADKLKKELFEIKVEADTYIYNLKKKISESIIEDEEILIKVNEKVKELDELLEGEAFTDLVAKYTELQEIYIDLEKVMKPDTSKAEAKSTDSSSESDSEEIQTKKEKKESTKGDEKEQQKVKNNEKVDKNEVKDKVKEKM